MMLSKLNQLILFLLLQLGVFHVLLELFFDQFPWNLESVSQRTEKVDHVLADYDPQVERLAFVQKLPENLVIVAFEVAEGQTNTFPVDVLEGIQRIVVQGGLWVHKEVELPLLDVDFVFKETGHVGHVFEESGSH